MAKKMQTIIAALATARAEAMRLIAERDDWKQTAERINKISDVRISTARAAGREEAAKFIEQTGIGTRKRLADGIRALKDNP